MGKPVVLLNDMTECALQVVEQVFGEGWAPGAACVSIESVWEREVGSGVVRSAGAEDHHQHDWSIADGRREGRDGCSRQRSELAGGAETEPQAHPGWRNPLGVGFSKGAAVVLVQPEMDRGRSPLVSIPPFGQGFSRHQYNHQAIPEQGCVPQSPPPQCKINMRIVFRSR